MAEATAATPPLTTLDTLAPGGSAVIRHLDGGSGVLSRFSALGLAPGTRVQVRQNFRRGPLIVQAHGTRIALGRGEAAKIRVEEGAA